LAHLDPRVTALRAAPNRYELKIHEVNPEAIIPNGDRYLVEVIEIDEKILLGQLLVVTQAPEDRGGPMADPNVERRGVLAAVIVTAGNGHLLGLPDPRIAVANSFAASDGGSVTYSRGSDTVERHPADVPMFYEPGDVVFVDFNARGRALKILNRECRLVNQIDVLAKLKGKRLKRTTDGGWEEA